MHKVLFTWWCWHICKGEENGEEEDMKPGSGCCLGITATPYPMHCHPCGGDRLAAEREDLAGALGGHRHCLSGGTAIPRVVESSSLVLVN